MSESLKNILVGIICIILFGFAYFFITGTDSNDGLTGEGVYDQAALVSKTQSFIERSRVLETITIDSAFFTNSSFTSLRSYSTDVPNQPLGKNDIFGSTQNSAVVSTKEDEAAE